MSRADDIAHHYDLSNDFYKLWLDDQMVYSCAYYPTGSEDINAAQIAKLDTICKKLRLAPGDTLLDVGCGWGALILHAVNKYGVTAHGITLSRNQLSHVEELIKNANISEKCRVSYTDYQHLPASEKYNKIVSVGMFEHVGKGKLPIYFEKLKSLLTPDGIFLNHGITRPRIGKRFGHSPIAKFMEEYIFPGGAVEDIGHILEALEYEFFEVHDVEQLRLHYVKTLEHWRERFTTHRAHLVTVVGEAKVRAWEIYLAGSQIAFETGGLNLYQVLVSPRQPSGKTSVPPTRNDLYR